MTDQPPNTRQTLADDLLDGADQIGKFIGKTPEQVYYLHRSGKLPIGKFGKGLLASKARLTSRIQKITG
jgi:hypothetical protein